MMPQLLHCKVTGHLELKFPAATEGNQVIHGRLMVILQERRLLLLEEWERGLYIGLVEKESFLVSTDPQTYFSGLLSLSRP